jgi:spore germination cell wall hydrolase CwlJ-like protein
MFEVFCLAAAVYFEARSEPLDAQAAVAAVVVERVRSDLYPDGICSVVTQPRQFSAFNDGFRPARDVAAWDRAVSVARQVLADPEGVSPIIGATHYHAVSVTPYWAEKFTPLGRSGKHLFYREVR